MADAEVKVRATFEAPVEPIEKMRQEMLRLRREAKELESMGAHKESRRVTREANRMEAAVDREGRRLLRVEDEEARRAKKAPIEAMKDRLSKGLVEEANARAAGNTKAADAMRSENEVMARALQIQRSRNVDAKQAMLIAREELAMKRAGAGLTLGGVLSTAGVGALLSQVGAMALGQMEFGESLDNRRVATSARNQRQMQILSGVRGSSGQLMAESWAAEDRAAETERQMPQMKTDQKYDMVRQGLTGAAVGAAVGSMVPVIGTALGAVIGGGIGAGSAWLGGRNKQGQATQDIEQDKKLAAEAKERAERRFREVEGGLEMDALRGRSRRSLGGQREAFTADMVAQGLAKYNQARHQGATEEMAKEMAELTVGNALRERQAAAGAGLVDMHSGGAGIAAAARWALESGPQQADITSRLDTLIGVVNRGQAEAEREDLSKK